MIHLIFTDLEKGNPKTVKIQNMIGVSMWRLPKGGRETNGDIVDNEIGAISSLLRSFLCLSHTSCAKRGREGSLEGRVKRSKETSWRCRKRGGEGEHLFLWSVPVSAGEKPAFTLSFILP